MANPTRRDAAPVFAEYADTVVNGLGQDVFTRVYDALTAKGHDEDAAGAIIGRCVDCLALSLRGMQLALLELAAKPLRVRLSKFDQRTQSALGLLETLSAEHEALVGRIRAAIAHERATLAANLDALETQMRDYRLPTSSTDQTRSRTDTASALRAAGLSRRTAEELVSLMEATLYPPDYIYELLERAQRDQQIYDWLHDAVVIERALRLASTSPDDLLKPQRALLKQLASLTDDERNALSDDEPALLTTDGRDALTDNQLSVLESALTRKQDDAKQRVVSLRRALPRSLAKLARAATTP